MKLPLTLLIAVIIATCHLGGAAKAAAPDPEISPDWPKWLRKAMQREKKRRKKTTDVVAGRFEFETIGKFVSADVTDDATYFFVDIGGESDVTCWIFEGHSYMASTVKGIKETLLAASAEAYGSPIGQQVVLYNDVGALDDIPYLANEWLYTVEVNGQNQIGILKMRAAQKNGLLYACAHQEVGYRKTFADFFERIIASVRMTDDDFEAPYWSEVVAITLEDQPLGVTWVEFRLDEDGDTKAVTETVMSVKVDDTTLTIEDSLQVEYSTPDGAVINTYYEVSENGEVTTALSLDATETGWAVSGDLQGKTVAFDLGEDIQPASSLGEYKVVADLLADTERQSVETYVWVPDADPSAFTTATIEVNDKGKTNSTATITMGPLAFTGNFENSTGSMLAGSMAIGPVSMTMERVHAQGEIK